VNTSTMNIPTRANPILVTGLGRSGTTWAGKMISSSGFVNYVGEVFNTKATIRGYDAPLFTQPLAYYTTQSSNPPVAIIQEILSNNGELNIRNHPRRTRFLKMVHQVTGAFPARVMLKDPSAVLSAEWMAQHFNMDVVALVRHPAGVASSFAKLGWPVYFDQFFLDQPALIADWLHPFEAQLRNPPEDYIDQVALLWACVNHVLLGYADRNPGWQLWRHEDLAADPLNGFTQIFAALDVPFTDQIRATVQAHSAAENPVDVPTGENKAFFHQRNSKDLVKRWKTKLTPAQIDRIRTITEPIASRLYGDEDW